MPRQLIDKRLNPPIPALDMDRDALLATIRDADPLDELPALVYADWQDEHNQPEHAELIRVMCDMEHSRSRDKRARRSVLLARMKELFKTPALKPLRELESDTWSFRRGFISNLCIELRSGLPAGPVRNRLLCGPPGQLDLPAYIPFDKVAWLGLKLLDHPTAELVGVVVSQPWFQRVDCFGVGSRTGGHIGPGVLGPLAKSPHLNGLRTFELLAGKIAADELVAIYLAKSAINLRELNLANLWGRITPQISRKPTQAAFVDAITHIVSSPRAAGLVSLGEYSVTLDDATARVLLDSKYLRGVTSLSYFADKLSARMRARIAERFGPPDQV